MGNLKKMFPQNYTTQLLHHHIEYVQWDYYLPIKQECCNVSTWNHITFPEWEGQLQCLVVSGRSYHSCQLCQNKLHGSYPHPHINHLIIPSLEMRILAHNRGRWKYHKGMTNLMYIGGKTINKTWFKFATVFCSWC